MAIVSECTTKGTSGWEVFFSPEGEVVMVKDDQVHHFPDTESVRCFLLGYEAAEEVFGGCDGCDCADEVVRHRVWRDGSSYESVFDKYEDAVAWMNFCDLASGECKMRYEALN